MIMIDERRYVIVVNREGILSPIRHIVELESGVPYFQDEFSAWYYDRYHKLNGDEFVYCLSSKEMREKEAQIKKEWDEEVPVAEKKAKWEQWKAEHTKNSEGTE